VESLRTVAVNVTELFSTTVPVEGEMVTEIGGGGGGGAAEPPPHPELQTARATLSSIATSDTRLFSLIRALFSRLLNFCGPCQSGGVSELRKQFLSTSAFA
jgi:hypothetical protein